uniref:PHM7_ext domain-containing protein n=1 Tax=Macrostomum lignano TaxID=282301 RepID=A0A1I8IPB0_9PLAT
ASPDQADTAKFTASPTPSPIVLTESPTHAGCRRRADRRRRRVRFADALGFELTNVRVVVCDPEEPPVIPGHVLAAGANYERQWDDDYGFGFEEGAVAERAAGVDKPPKPAPLGYSTCWRPLFSTQPPTDAVERRVADEKIAMESVRLETMALEASVQVQNLGPVKQVCQDWLGTILKFRSIRVV